MYTIEFTTNSFLTVEKTMKVEHSERILKYLKMVGLVMAMNSLYDKRFMAVVFESKDIQFRITHLPTGRIYNLFPAELVSVMLKPAKRIKACIDFTLAGIITFGILSLLYYIGF